MASGPPEGGAYGTLFQYLDANDGTESNIVDQVVTKWWDHSGYLSPFGKNHFQRVNTDQGPILKQSSTVKLSNNVGSKYVRFLDTNYLAGVGEDGNYDTAGLSGTYTGQGGPWHPFFDLYILGNLETNTGSTDQRWWSCADYISPTYTERYFLRQTGSGGSNSTVVGDANNVDLVYQPEAYWGVDKWKIWSFHAGLTEMRLYRGKTQKAVNGTPGFGSMQKARQANLGNKGGGGAGGDPRGIMLMLLYLHQNAQEQGHSATEIGGVCDWIAGFLPNGPNGGTNLF